MIQIRTCKQLNLGKLSSFPVYRDLYEPYIKTLTDREFGEPAQP